MADAPLGDGRASAGVLAHVVVRDRADDRPIWPLMVSDGRIEGAA